MAWRWMARAMSTSPTPANNAIKEWIGGHGTVTTLVSRGLSYPEGVAVDGAGNVYIADAFYDHVHQRD